MTIRTLVLFFFVSIFQHASLYAQQATFSQADSLRGALSPERLAYDVNHYDIDLALTLQDSSIKGTVSIAYTGQLIGDTIQVDLDQRLTITEITQGAEVLGFRRVADAVFVGLAEATQPNQPGSIRVAYHGQPLVARRPPWDGGLTITADSLGRPWVGVSCEGIGASKWWPNKDHLSDEPDSVTFSMSVPDPLRMISNGRFVTRKSLPGGRSKFTYKVGYPINNYNVTFYVGHYLTFSDTLQSKAHDTPLALNYAVLDYNLSRSRKHFQQVKPMLRCYESILGAFPFWNDGYGLIEAPYLGMEHQSGIAYGNNYMRGYRGGMIPPDMNWDYLIIHESGHEYFGNAVSTLDHGEMWLHESFTTYLEALYVECRFGNADYQRYLNGQRNFISNTEPIVGPHNVNFTDFASSDYYFKGSWVLHTFRNQIGDEAFLGFLKSFYQKNAVGYITTADWIDETLLAFGDTISSSFWRQYLFEASIPKLQVQQVGGEKTSLFFMNTVPGFKLNFHIDGDPVTITNEPILLEKPLSELEPWLKVNAERSLLEY